MATPDRSGIVVFSGGSATNSLVDVFESVRASTSASISYVIPISDNGGSTSEIIRVFGGPGIGDVRSRLVRLIPEPPSTSPTSSSVSPPPPPPPQPPSSSLQVSSSSLPITNTTTPPPPHELVAVKLLFNHRLPPDSYEAARAEWFLIAEGSHPLWRGISSPKRELIRSFLNAFNHELLKRLRPSSRFDYSGASVGNLFLTGARLFTGSFEAAIYLLSQVCGVPGHVDVLPALNTNFAHHIAAGLSDGSVIFGQNDISHPSIPSAAVQLPTGLNTPAVSSASSSPIDCATPNPGPFSLAGAFLSSLDGDDEIEDANLPGSLPALRRPAIRFSKDQEEPLPSRISRLWYINPYGHEIRLPANPRILSALSSSHTVIFSIGSLFTSIVPCLILKGVGEAIATKNPSTSRPSSSSSNTSSLSSLSSSSSSSCIAHKILILNGTIDRETSSANDPAFTALDFVAAIANACAQSRGRDVSSSPLAEEDYSTYVTHLIYLEGPRSPAVDRPYFARLGIDTTRLYGPSDGRYDGKALAQRLESIIGHPRTERRRRNTMMAL